MTGRIGAKYWIFATLTPFLIVMDQVTKAAIVNRFRFGEAIDITSFFQLTHVRNTGAAFGILADSHAAFRVPFFIIVPVIALATIVYVFRKIGDNDRRMAFALSLVISGAIGNLIDRVRLSYVIDFLYFHWKEHFFPAFNVADSGICVGVGLLMLDLLREKR